MDKPWKSENDHKKIPPEVAHFTIPEAALLWCGVPYDQIQAELKKAHPLSEKTEREKIILVHPRFPLLKNRCQLLVDATNNHQLSVGRDGRQVDPNDTVAYSRRTIILSDLKAWISNRFPNDKPDTLFDEFERNVHTAITKDAYQALQAEKNALDYRLEKAKEAYLALKTENQSLAEKIKSLEKDLTLLKKESPPEARSETAYQNIIGALVSLMLQETPSGRKISIYDSQSKIIEALVAYFPNVYGISVRNLQEKFAQANTNLNQY